MTKWCAKFEKDHYELHKLNFIHINMKQFQQIYYI